MKAIVFDYGAGNLFSLVRALEVLGVEAAVEADARRCAASDELLVLPGVGAFGLAASRLAPARDELSRQLRAGRPCIGICLGMQVLFDASEEGAGAGLSVMEGRVTRLRSPRCPHIGWTRVDGGEFYFAHSFACRPADSGVVQASATFEGDSFPAIVRRARTIGVQFHPEKSSRRGVELLGQLIREIVEGARSAESKGAPLTTRPSTSSGTSGARATTSPSTSPGTSGAGATTRPSTSSGTSAARITVIPAIDLREGACVQLVGGDYANERVRLTDVRAVAKRWRDAGFTRLHVVDLDAATGRGSNAGVITQLLDTDVDVQVGGGIRDEAQVEDWLARGAARVVVGTRAIEDAAWLERTAQRFPRRVVVAADVRGERVVTRGWAEGSALTYRELLARLSPLPLAGVLMTAVHVEGRLEGPDLELVRGARPLTPFPLIASGGVACNADVSALADAGADAVVVGMALYTGRLDASSLPGDFK